MTDFQKFYRNEGDYPQLDGRGPAAASPPP